MAICLPKKYTERFIKTLKAGGINPEKMAGMTSAERRSFLSKIVGEENAKFVNAEFESKLLLKNQQRGMVTWAKRVAGLKPEIRRDLISRIQRMDKALDTASEKTFVADLVEKRLGLKVSRQEAQQITNYTNKMSELYENARAKLGENALPEEVFDRLTKDPKKTYFHIQADLQEYLLDLTPSKVPTTKLQAVGKYVTESTMIGRTIKTAFDLSFPLRQGRAYMGTTEWNRAFKNMFSYAKSKSAIHDLRVRMLSDPYSKYALKNKRILGLTLIGEKATQREEQFMSKWVEKIPFLRGSERAFVGFANDLRFTRFTNILKALDKAGRGITDNPEAMQELAKTIAAGSGRGQLGCLEMASGPLATAMFSPRWFVSRFQVIFNPLLKIRQGPARKEAIKQVASLAGTSAAILGMAKMAGADVETDMRSANFGKIKVGNTRFDITGGMAPYITLMIRQATSSTKSSTTGKITKLGAPEWGARTRWDVATDFITNKASPVGRAIIDVMKGKTFEGKPLKWDMKSMGYMVDQLITPLIGKEAFDTFNQSSGGSQYWMTGAVIATEMFGISANTYLYKPTTKAWKTLEKQQGEAVYNEAVKKFNTSFHGRLKQLQSKKSYKSVDQEGKNDMIDDLKNQLTSKILKEYGIKVSPESGRIIKEKTIKKKKKKKSIFKFKKPKLKGL